MSAYFSSAGKAIRLGKAVGAGGEATVYQVQGQPARLAKLYTGGPRPGYAAKLAWMADHPPENDPAAPGHRALAWPLDLLYAGQGPTRSLAGYLMPFVRGAAPLLEVFNPRLRQRILPGFDRRYLHRAARNLASALAALHAHQYVVGDLNESNILVTPSALVTLIDVDSFQVTEWLPDGGLPPGGLRVHPCPVGKLEYTPPELQGQALSEATRLPEHDAFGLGVLIFQLLMEGNHPFRARWLAPGDPPPLEQRMAAGMFPYVAGHDQRVRPPQGAPALEALSPRLAELVRRCFSDARHNPALRPSPAEWARALADAERNLLPCPRGHWFSAHLPACPVCGALNPQRAAPAGRVATGQPMPAPTPQSAGVRSAPAEPVSPPPGVRNPRPAAAPAGARAARASRPSPPPPGAGEPQTPYRGAAQAASQPPPPAAASAANRAPNPSPNLSADLQQRAWAFARRQAVTMLRRRYPWIPAAWAGAPAAGAAAPAAGPSRPAAPASAAPASAAASAPPRAAPQTSPAPSGAQTPAGAGPASAGRAPGSPPPVHGPLPRAPYSAPPTQTIPVAPAASRAPNFWTSRFLLRSLGNSALLGGGRGLLAGALPGLLAAVGAGLLGVSAEWLALAAVGGAAGAAASAWTPGNRLAHLIDRRLGWRPLLGGLGALLGAGLGALVSLPIFFLVIPVILGLFFGGKIGLDAGRRVHDLGVRFGWERIGRWGGLVTSGVWGAWLGGKLAGSTLGLEIGAWTAAQAAALSAWVGSPAAAWALAGALAGGLGGALCGFLIDLPARLTRLTE